MTAAINSVKLFPLYTAASADCGSAVLLVAFSVITRRGWIVVATKE